SSVARRYDLMNDLMSLGIHRVWKRYFVATAQVKRGDRVLDLAGGTGDIALLLHERVGRDGSIVLGDINGDMLRVGRD
ncbi:class I SAM-dependent methyltransferase, partial [Acinetobacter baumannii]